MINDFTKLEIKDLKINAIIGIHEQEKTSKQPLIIDLTVYFDSKLAIETDNINDVVDYYDMSSDLINFVSNSKFELIETLSCKILERVLSNKKIKKAILSITCAINGSELISINGFGVFIPLSKNLLPLPAIGITILITY